MGTFRHRPLGWDEDVTLDDYRSGMEGYHASLKAKDFSGAGDLLPYFGRDFFHDAGIEITVPDGENRVELRMTAFILIGEEDSQAEVEIQFLVELLDVHTLSVEFDLSQARGLDTFGYSEIDGLDKQIEVSQATDGGVFHSLTIACVGGWVKVVFRSARVAPLDPVLWMGVVRNPTARLAIFGLD